MSHDRTRLGIMRQTKRLARVYVNVFRPESYEEEFMEPEHTMNSRQACEMLSGAVRLNYVEEIGERATLRVLRAASRPYMLRKYALRVGVLSCIPVLVYVHGAVTAVLLQTVIYLSTRPFAWKNRGRGARVAERILRHRIDLHGRERAVGRALAAELSHIPAKALHSRQWRDHLEKLLPTEEDVREIAVKLSDQYEGSLQDLTETSRALAR